MVNDLYLENQTEKRTFINDDLNENQYLMMIVKKKIFAKTSSAIRFRGLFNHNYTLICMPKTNLRSYLVHIAEKGLTQWDFHIGQPIPNGCFDAYEVKVNKDIFQYQEKVNLISLLQRFF